MTGRGAGKKPGLSRAELNQNEGLVRSLAWQAYRQYAGKVPYDDLLAYGFLGLAEAAERFDPSRGASFSTYAYPRVNGSIRNGARAFTRERGRGGTDEASDFIEQTGPTLGARAWDGSAQPGFIPETAQARLSAAEARAKVAMHLGELPEQLRELLRLVYVSGLTLKEAGEHMSLSKSWASRAHGRALKELAKRMAMAKDGGHGS